MPVNGSVKRLAALVLAAGAVVVVAEPGTPAVGAGPGVRAVNASAHGQGNARAVPPILRPARPSELAAIRSSEAPKGRAVDYDPSASARYSNADMNAFATEGSCGS